MGWVVGWRKCAALVRPPSSSFYLLLVAREAHAVRLLHPVCMWYLPNAITLLVGARPWKEQISVLVSMSSKCGAWRAYGRSPSFLCLSRSRKVAFPRGLYQ